MTLSFQVTPV